MGGSRYDVSCYLDTIEVFFKFFICFVSDGKLKTLAGETLPPHLSIVYQKAQRWIFESKLLQSVGDEAVHTQLTVFKSSTVEPSSNKNIYVSNNKSKFHRQQSTTSATLASVRRNLFSLLLRVHVASRALRECTGTTPELKKKYLSSKRLRKR